MRREAGQTFDVLLFQTEIGEGFGGRDHTTVMHATAKIQKLMGEQRQVYTEIQQLTNAVKQKSSS